MAWDLVLEISKLLKWVQCMCMCLYAHSATLLRIPKLDSSLYFWKKWLKVTRSTFHILAWGPLSFHKCCRMERNSVEFLEGEIFIISQIPCRLAVTSRAFWCLKEGVLKIYILSAPPQSKEERPFQKHSLVTHFSSFHKKPAQFIIPNQYLHGMGAFCGFLVEISTGFGEMSTG